MTCEEADLDSFEESFQGYYLGNWCGRHTEHRTTRDAGGYSGRADYST
jgi:hypothetical protein